MLESWFSYRPLRRQWLGERAPLKAALQPDPRLVERRAISCQERVVCSGPWSVPDFSRNSDFSLEPPQTPNTHRNPIVFPRSYEN